MIELSQKELFEKWITETLGASATLVVQLAYRFSEGGTKEFTLTPPVVHAYKGIQERNAKNILHKLKKSGVFIDTGKKEIFDKGSKTIYTLRYEVGTKSVPSTKNVRGTKSVPSTKNVLGVGTKNVLGVGTKNVPQTLEETLEETLEKKETNKEKSELSRMSESESREVSDQKFTEDQDQTPAPDFADPFQEKRENCAKEKRECSMPKTVGNHPESDEQALEILLAWQEYIRCNRIKGFDQFLSFNKKELEKNYYKVRDRLTKDSEDGGQTWINTQGKPVKNWGMELRTDLNSWHFTSTQPAIQPAMNNAQYSESIVQKLGEKQDELQDMKQAVGYQSAQALPNKNEDANSQEHILDLLSKDF